MFAHRGASAYAPENSLEAFQLAMKLGATGLETDCWLTLDNEVILDHDGVVKNRRFKKFGAKKISTVRFNDLEKTIIKFSQLLELVDVETPLSIDVCDIEAMSRINESANDQSNCSRIYICHPDIEILADWKIRYPNFKYVNSIRLGKITEGPEMRCARLSRLNLDALNMHRTDWNGGLVALAHRFGLGAFCWDLQHREQIENALLMGTDAIYSDWPDRMVDAFKNTLIN